MMSDAVMGVMSFGDGENGYQAACKEYRQSLEAEKTKKHISSAEPEGTDLPIPWPSLLKPISFFWPSEQ